MNSIFLKLSDSIRKRKGLFITLLILSLVIIIFAIYSAITFESVAITIDIGNVTYIKFLKGDIGFLALVLGSILSVLIFYFIVFACCGKKFLIPLAVVFYLYFVYCQMVVFTSIIIIYGFFNVLILAFLLLAILLCEFALFILTILELASVCNSPCYFKDCFNSRLCCFGGLLLCLVLLLIIFSIMLSILKAFVFLLVF